MKKNLRPREIRFRIYLAGNCKDVVSNASELMTMSKRSLGADRWTGLLEEFYCV